MTTCRGDATGAFPLQQTPINVGGLFCGSLPGEGPRQRAAVLDELFASQGIIRQTLEGRDVGARVPALDHHHRVTAHFLQAPRAGRDRKSTRLNSSHGYISYAVFCLKTKTRTPP